MNAQAALHILVVVVLSLTLLAMAERLHSYRAAKVRMGVPQTRFRRRKRAVGDSDELAMMAMEVVTRLRAGSTVPQAWGKTWSRHRDGEMVSLDVSGVPEIQCECPRQRSKKRMWQRAWDAIAAACKFSFLSGAPLADVLEVIAEGISQDVKAREAQNRAFMGPMLSARVLAALPVIAVIGGEALGAGSLQWFVMHPLGRLCCVCGVVMLASGVAVGWHLVGKARRAAQERLEGTLLCDLAGAGLKTGASLPLVLSHMAAAAEMATLEVTAKQLLMGSPWDFAWEADERTRLLRGSLQPAWEDGVSPVPLLTLASQQARDRSVARVEEEAAALSVKLVIPLGALLLPSFVLLGIAPIVFSLFKGQVML